MRFFVVISMSVIFGLVSWSAFGITLDKTDHLFFIERSKNRNFVQYDIRLTENNEVPDSNPVAVYWVLENGRQQDLNTLERKYAYGIDSHEKLDKNRFRLLLIALKDREIIVEKMRDSFKAIVAINGKPSILDRVYVETKERLAGLPKVLYIDLFGHAKETGLPINERIIPR